jgi:hypothetical protein
VRGVTETRYAYGSLNFAACSCVSITAPGSS